MTKPTPELRYEDAGVDIEAGNELVGRLKKHVQTTQRAEVMSGLGGFGGLFQMPTGYQKPVLVSATDGVGTKLKLAMAWNQHASVGIDLVAMCVNDLIVTGAEPLFFLDYYATGKLNIALAEEVIAGIAEGCRQAGCALIGGETAEMPGLYQGEDYDLAGFCTGVVEADAIIDGSQVSAGDAVIGLASSGVHSNGYSLVRKIIARADCSPDLPIGTETLANALLTPTRIYVKPLLRLLKVQPVHAIAHITGGGFWENLPRVVPSHLALHLDASQWQRQPIFDWLQTTGGISDSEMLRTFNCGIGMVLIVPKSVQADVIALLREQGEQAMLIGEIVSRTDHPVLIDGLTDG